MIIVRPVLPVRCSVSWFNKAILGLDAREAPIPARLPEFLATPGRLRSRWTDQTHRSHRNPSHHQSLGQMPCSRWLSMHTTELEILPLVQKSYPWCSKRLRPPSSNRYGNLTLI